MFAKFCIPTDLPGAYPSYRDELLSQAEEKTETRLAIRGEIIKALQKEINIDTQACLVDLLTQLNDTAGWWSPSSTVKKQNLTLFKTILSAFKLDDIQIQELLPRAGNRSNHFKKNPSLRNNPEDAYMQLALYTAIVGAGLYPSFSGLEIDNMQVFLAFMKQCPEVVREMKKTCIQAYKQWGNLSGPLIPSTIALVAKRHSINKIQLTVDDFKNAWYNHQDEILVTTQQYPVNTHSPLAPRYNIILKKTLSILLERTIPLKKIGDFGSGIVFGPIKNICQLMDEYNVPKPHTIYAFDRYPEKLVRTTNIEGIALHYTQQDISDPAFIKRQSPSLDFAMSMSVYPHLRSEQRVSITKGVLSKAKVFLIEGAIFGRNYWNEQDPSFLLPRFPHNEHNGWLFIKNKHGGLDFIPLNSIA